MSLYGLLGILLALLLVIPGWLLAIWLQHRYGRQWREWIEQVRRKRL